MIQQDYDCLHSSISSELTALNDGDGLLGLAGLGANGGHVSNDVEAIDDLAEDDVLSVEVREGVEGNEELAAVGVLASVGHGEEATTDVLVEEVLILELHAIDGLATGAVSSGEVATLSHKARDDSVEAAALVVEGLAGLADALLASAESSEVLRGHGGVGEQVEGDAASGLTTNGDVKEDLGVRHIVFFLFLSFEDLTDSECAS